MPCSVEHLRSAVIGATNYDDSATARRPVGLAKERDPDGLQGIFRCFTYGRI